VNEVPPGYREAFIVAVTVILGFSVLYLKFVVLDPESGPWSVTGGIATVFGVISCLLQLLVLWRGLQPADHSVAVYAKTLRWFLAAIVTLAASVLILALAFLIGSLSSG
jgi:hypothetical protein